MDSKIGPALTGIRWWVWVACVGALALVVSPGATIGALFLLGPTALWTACLIGVAVLVFRALGRGRISSNK
jgi:hypothetical protein